MTNSILIEPGSRFQCLPECGFCCGFWDIIIEEPRKEHLLELDWVQEIERDLKLRKNQTLFPILGQTNQSIIQRQHGTCSFINEQKLCSIHAHEGMDAKPLRCQQYPYLYYRTPRGVEVLLDFSCPEVIKNAGELVTVEEIEGRLPREFVLTVPEHLPLTPRIQLTWDAYAHLESALLETLQLDFPTRDRILCMHHIAAELSRNLESRGSSDSTIVQQVLGEITVEKLQRVLTNFRGLQGSSSKRDLYLAILIQLVEATYSRKLRDEASASGSLFLKIWKHWKGLGAQNLEVFKLKVKHAHLKTVEFDDNLLQFKSVTDRYLRYLVRTLLNTGRMPILKRLAIISANYAIVDWVARARAAELAHPQAELGDLVFGIQIVEKFMSNRLFNELSSQGNFIAKVVHAMFDNPALPSILLAGRS